MVFFLPVLLFGASCLTTRGGDGVDARSERYNLRFLGYDSDVHDPSGDRRSYYKIFIDKVEAGRTTTGLESQKKSFEARIQANRHLLTVEKWVLDPKKEANVKVNISDSRSRISSILTWRVEPCVTSMEVSSDNRAFSRCFSKKELVISFFLFFFHGTCSGESATILALF
jgi:hypothetical protein